MAGNINVLIAKTNGNNMILGAIKFRCSSCINTFMGVDIELGATDFTAPLECLHYGSKHTRPWQLTDIIPTLRKKNDDTYRSIWKESLR